MAAESLPFDTPNCLLRGHVGLSQAGPMSGVLGPGAVPAARPAEGRGECLLGFADLALTVNGHALIGCYRPSTPCRARTLSGPPPRRSDSGSHLQGIQTRPSLPQSAPRVRAA